MFQYAFYLSLKNKVEDLNVDLSFFYINNQHNGYELDKLFGLNLNKINCPNSYFNSNLIKKILKRVRREILIEKIIQDNFKYQDLSLILNKNNIYLNGYWQSEKYFKNIESKIRELYKFPAINEENNLELLEEIKELETVSIHIRRGDYIGHPELDGLAPIKYYENSIKYIKSKVKNPVFLIFSNDIEWCKENLQLNDEQVYYVDWNIKENSFRDMQLMSLCKHNIIPNSSFSWWGAWLNRNPRKIVIAPEKWFTDESKLPYKDIVPEEWIKIKNY